MLDSVWELLFGPPKRKKEKSNMFMRGFNSFQLTTLFAAGPFIIEWVKNAAFYGHGALFWVLIIAYLIGFVAMCCAVYSASTN